ncbi:hypothetical protein CEXT_33631 [Caerostris extrusa]|uniref:Uncharacterized protein n=1 Tax=Caerostris extrusa TaxID=172846 RepID=A0AAV4PP09_CAEEX|nr:hypothetical protein CEXT_33631 [Caerostris extrusa]
MKHEQKENSFLVDLSNKERSRVSDERTNSELGVQLVIVLLTSCLPVTICFCSTHPTQTIEINRTGVVSFVMCGWIRCFNVQILGMDQNL